MSLPVVRAESVGKRYRLGQGADPGSLAEAIERTLAAPIRWLRRQSKSDAAGPDPELWAVRDVSFDVHHGEAFGLVGANGAGKSTMLKLLSRITLPTEGRVTTVGRVSTLIEVGTGFHPELTGRENVYLNGAILGMGRREIAAKYDEIVEFAGIERFMETPVKRYSSGMHIRLGFAVAAHLDPDILIVDEVLSVGDNEFQRKSMGKMREVAGEGRTVIFVSHNLNAIQRLCSRAVLLDKGRIVAEGDPEAVVGDYLGRTGGGTSEEVTIVPEEADRNGTGEARLRKLTMTDLDGNPIAAVHVGQRFRVIATFEVFSEIDEAALEVGILTMDGEQVVTAQNIDGDRPPTRIPTGMQDVAVELSVTLMPHEFQLAIGMHRMNGRTVDHIRRIHRFTALNSNREGGDHYRWPSVRGFARAQSVWHEPRPSTDEPSEPVVQGRPRG